MNKRLHLCLLSMLFPSLAIAAHQGFYADVGSVSITKDNESDSGFVTHFGYNYYLTPFAALDLGYTNITSFDSNVNQNSTDFSTSINGINTGIKLQHNIGLFSVYAKGGVSFLKLTETTWDPINYKFVDDSSSDTAPYIKAGVTMESPWSKKMHFTGNYSYQKINAHYSTNSISFGIDFQY